MSFMITKALPQTEPTTAPSEVLSYAIADCDLGKILVARGADGVCSILLGDSVDELVTDFASRFPQAMLVPSEEAVKGDLAKVLHLDPSTLTGVLQQMGQRGLLQLQPDMRDRRRLRIQLTTKGRRMSHMAVGAIEAAVTRTLSRVSPAKLKATREVLALLADNLDRHGDVETLTDQATSA